MTPPAIPQARTRRSVHPVPNRAAGDPLESTDRQGRSASADPASPAEPGRTRSSWRAVALPSEHGGWGLTFEPVLLGLLIMPSVAGVAIGLAALVAFVARTPLKLVLVDRWRHRNLPRTGLAARIAAAELAALVALLVVAFRTADGRFWIPLALAVPFFAVELWFDMRSRGRRLVPELAGSIGIGSVAAAIVIADGGPVTVAAGAWLVIVARATASLPFVRYQLRRIKHQPYRRWADDLAQLAAVTIAALGFALGWLPGAVLAAVGALVIVQLVLARIPPPRAVISGVQQLIFGLAVVITAGLTMA